MSTNTLGMISAIQKIVPTFQAPVVTPTAKATVAATTTPKAVSTPQVSTSTNVNQDTTFAPITITPISGSVSLLGGGAGGGSIEISQISQPTSNVTTQVSNTFATTEYNTNQYTIGSEGTQQTSAPITNITPSQVATQTATPTATTAQAGGGGMEWWQYLIIGGIALGAIYMITKALKGKKKQKNRSIDNMDVVKLATMI